MPRVWFLAESATRIVVLISGRGSNALALAQASAKSPATEVVGVLSNEPTATGLQAAAELGLHTACVAHRDFPSRAAFDQALREKIDQLTPDLVVLAGFMRILTPAFIAHFQGRLINIHPSLLPAYPGLDTHQRALRDGVSWHGATVHFVSDELDGGPRIACARVSVLSEDTADSLATRVLAQEHRLLPSVVEWFATGRLRLESGMPVLDDVTLSSPHQL